MRVLFAGGGTGGHIYPALALARHLQHTDDAQILFAGTERGMEKEIVPANGFPLQMVPVVGLERKLSLQTGRALFLAAASVVTARRIIKSFKPDVVVGTGGYVAGPVVLAAKLSGIPTVIHEQNAIPGLTNVVLARMAGRVCVSVAESTGYFPNPKKTVLTGNPRASEAVQATGEPALPRTLLPRVPLLLCVGGSHGAAKLNEAFTGSVASVLSACDVQIVYVTGKRYFEEIEQELAPQKVRFPQRLQVIPYHPALPQLLHKANLVVSRAGATTLAEITALGVPAVLVPSPNVTNNHQEFNAKALSDHGAAVLLRESELGAEKLSDLLTGLFKDGNRLRKMAADCKALGVPDAAERMSVVIRGLLKS